MSEEEPGIAGRLGQVIYWFGCALGVLSIPAAALAFYMMWSQFGVEGSTFFPAALCLGAGVGCWPIGRAARYILRGD